MPNRSKPSSQATTPPSIAITRDGVGMWLLVAMGAGALALGFAMIDAMTEFRSGETRAVATSWRPRIETGIYTVLLSALILAAFRLRRELARAESRSQQLEESERKFRELADTAPAMIWQCDDQGRCVFASASWLDFRGRTLEQEMGWGWVEGLHAEDAENFLRVFKRMVAEGEPLSAQVRFRNASGEYRTILNKGSPRSDETGRLVGFLGCCIDIEDLTRAEAQREITERRLKVMMNNTPAIAFIKDLEGRYQFVNRRYEELLNLSSEQMLGRTDDDLFPQASATLFRDNDRRVIASGGPVREEHVVQIDGVDRTYLSTKFPLRGLDGQIYGLGGLTTDITDRKAAEEIMREHMLQITASLERERTLMRELDHRVRNNLAGLLGLVSIYERTGRPGGEMAGAVRGKVLAMRDVHEIISRGNGGPISLNQLVRKIALGVLPESRVADLACVGPEVSIPPAKAHAMAMVLHELVINSTKHGALGGSEGSVRLEWLLGPGGMLRLEWSETCPVRAATAKETSRGGGVGLSLIGGLCRSELRGEFEHAPGPAGFHAVISAHFGDERSDTPESQEPSHSIEVPS